MDKARAKELLANERARLERLRRAEIAATAPDQGDDVDDANWRIAEETGRAVSRSLRDRWSALERAEERFRRGTYGRSIASGRQIPDERLEADPLAELLVEEAAVEAFRARRSSETVSGLTSTRRTLAALADRGEATDDSSSGAAGQAEEGEVDAEVESPDETEELDVEELEEGELIDEDEEAPAEFEDEAEEVEEEEEDEAADEAQGAVEEEKERPPQRRRSGRR